ncbi:MAG: hypothetical protein ACRDYC_05590 [Acidimicrobiales bacterium]
MSISKPKLPVDAADIPSWLARSYRAMVVVFALFVAVIIANAIVQDYTIIHLQDHNSALAKQVHGVLDTINSCVQPQGKCAEQGAKNTNAIVGPVTVLLTQLVTLETQIAAKLGVTTP